MSNLPMKIHTYSLLMLIALHPVLLVNAHSCKPSAPTLEEIDQQYAPSAPSKGEFETPTNQGDFDPEELQEATRRSLEDQNKKFEIDKKGRVSIGVVIILILIYLNTFGKNSK